MKFCEFGEYFIACYNEKEMGFMEAAQASREVMEQIDLSKPFGKEFSQNDQRLLVFSENPIDSIGQQEVDELFNLFNQAPELLYAGMKFGTLTEAARWLHRFGYQDVFVLSCEEEAWVFFKHWNISKCRFWDATITASRFVHLMEHGTIIAEDDSVENFIRAALVQE